MIVTIHEVSSGVQAQCALSIERKACFFLNGVSAERKNGKDQNSSVLEDSSLQRADRFLFSAVRHNNKYLVKIFA